MRQTKLPMMGWLVIVILCGLITWALMTWDPFSPSPTKNTAPAVTTMRYPSKIIRRVEDMRDGEVACVIGSIDEEGVPFVSRFSDIMCDGPWDSIRREGDRYILRWGTERLDKALANRNIRMDSSIVVEIER